MLPKGGFPTATSKKFLGSLVCVKSPTMTLLSGYNNLAMLPVMVSYSIPVYWLLLAIASGIKPLNKPTPIPGSTIEPPLKPKRDKAAYTLRIMGSLV